MEKLTQMQAFLAMAQFLEAYYERGKSDEIGGLLGSLQILDDGLPGDPALWQDWMECVQKVLSVKQEIG